MLLFRFHRPEITSGELFKVAKKKPISANGNAKMVCENLTNDK